ncbi:hypothetical protein LTS10_005655 [Elasticomyces elasticus]|nr:hypothetical protein LTS10_005655 [Elasticomyces elasticus]
MSKPIALILGAGKNIGASSTKAFQAKGYRVAQAARSLQPQDSTDNDLLLKCDLSKPELISSVFADVRKSWGEPSVVIYNASAAHFTFPDDAFNVSPEDFATDYAINVTSAYLSIKEAVASFRTLPSEAAKAFFYTGNCLNTGPLDGKLLGMMTSGVGKSGAAFMIQTAANSYGGQGMKFYYVDERTPEGKPAISPYVDGPGHAEFFIQLAEGTAGKVPALATFVTDKGYTSFPKL